MEQTPPNFGYRASLWLNRIHDALVYGGPEGGDPHEPAQSKAATAAIVMLVLIPFAIDMATWQINVGPIYTLPLLMFARVGRRRHVLYFALLLMALTYAGYLFGVHRPASGIYPADTFSILLHRWTGMLNRGISACTLLLVALISMWWIGLRTSMRQWGAALLRSDEDRQIYGDMVDSFEFLFARVISIILLFMLAVMDYLTPANFNIPVFYFIPLLICGVSRSRWLLWIETACALVLAWVDFKWGPQALPGTVRSPMWLEYNRILACVTLLAAAVMLHMHMPNRPPHRIPRHLRPEFDDQE